MHQRNDVWNSISLHSVIMLSKSDLTSSSPSLIMRKKLTTLSTPVQHLACLQHATSSDCPACKAAQFEVGQ